MLGMASILVPADVPRLLAALDELACFPDEDVRQSVVIMLAGLTGLLSQKSCTEMLLPRVMRLLEDNAYLVRKVTSPRLLPGLGALPDAWSIELGLPFTWAKELSSPLQPVQVMDHTLRKHERDVSCNNKYETF